MFTNAALLVRATRFLTAMVAVSCISDLGLGLLRDANLRMPSASGIVRAANRSIGQAPAAIALRGAGISATVARSAPGAAQRRLDCCCHASCHASMPDLSAAMLDIGTPARVNRVTTVWLPDADRFHLLPPPKHVA